MCKCQIISTLESLHIGQWAMGNGRQNLCPLPIAYCPVAPSLHFSGNGQWAVGGCMHTNLPPIAHCPVLPSACIHGQWAMSDFFPPIAHCSALPSGCIRGQWALGGMPTCVAHLRCLGGDLGDFGRPNGQWATRACHFEPV